MKNFLSISFFILFNIYFISNSYTKLHISNDSFIVKKINIEGLQRISLNTVQSNIYIHVGKTTTDDDIARTIKILFSTGYFENIHILKKQNLIIIQVKEYPLLSHITFHGNQTIKKNILTKNLKLHGIQEGKLFNQKHILKIEETLKNFYYDLGKYNISIKTIITNLPNNIVNLKIIFNEGKSINIKKINIIGNNQFTDNKLLKLFQLHNQIPGSDIFFKKKYQKKTLLNDLKSLNNFYLNKGFAKFNVDSTQIRLTPDKKEIYLTIYITEGLQYKISNIFIKGNLSNFSHKINSLLTIHPHEFYNKQKIQNFIQNTKKILENHGYINPKILTEIETNDVDQTLKLYININIGQCFYINKIKFIGNTITKDSVLRREIRHMEKTWINRNLLDKGKEQLIKTGYFENVKIKYEYIPMTLDQLDIIYKVKERNSGSMNINFGIGTNSGINFQCGIQQENLFGTGNSLTLNAIKNSYQTYIESSTNHPYFYANRFNLGEKIFYNSFNAENTDLADYGLKSYGTNITIGFQINENNILNFSLDNIHNNLSNIKPQVVIWRYLNSQNISLKNININPSNDNQISNNIRFSSNDFFLTIHWKRNTLNHPFFPTHGSYSDFSGKVTIPASNNEYYKIIINNSYYLPLYKKSNYWILMSHMYAGYSAGLSKKESPFYDNFYSGGNNIVRGFRPNTIGPKAAYYTCTSNDKIYNTCSIKNSQDAIGGNAITILKGELIIPSPFINKKYANIIRTSIFIDLGTVWDTYWKNTLATRMANIPNYKDPTNIRISNGIAIQWLSPIGPIIFSYAKLIKKYTGDKLEQFQFNIGKTW